MNEKSINKIRNIGRKILVVLLTIAIQVQLLPSISHEVKAEGTQQHKVEIYRGYGKKAGSETLAGVLSNKTDTGYSIVGYTTGDYTIPDSPSPVTNYRYSQSFAKNADATSLIKIKSITVYYGDNNIDVAFSGTATGSQSKYVDVAADGTLSISSSQGTNTVVVLVYKNPTTSANGSLYVKPITISADMDIVLHYCSGETGAGVYEYTVTVNNVDSISDYGRYNSTTTTSKVLTMPKFNASGYIPLTVTPKAGKTIRSIDVNYADKYKMTIAKTELASSKTETNGKYTYNGDNTFNLTKFEKNYVITYNYETEVTFDPNGGLFSDSTSAVKSGLTSDGKLAADDIYSGLTRTHETDSNIIYSFKGWYDNNTGNYTDDHKITADYEFTTETATVYAIWENNYKVTINPNGGEFTDDTTENKVYYTDAVNFSGKLSSLPSVKSTKTVGQTEYYSLEQYYTSATDFTEENLVTTDTVFSTDTEIYAGWTDEKETVTFHANGQTYETKEVGKGQTVSAPATNPTKAGYTFVGWYTDENYATAFDFTQKITANKDAYALFVETATITVTGAVTGTSGSISSSTVSAILSLDDDTDTVIVKKNEALSANLTINTSNGVVNQIKVNNTVIAKADLDSTVYVASDYTVSASAGAADVMSIVKDAANKNVTITLGTITQDTAIELSYDDVTITYKDGTTVLGTDTAPFNTKTTITKPEDPSKDGYVFDDWYKEEGFTNKFAFTDVILDGDVDVYAKFNIPSTFEYVYGYGRTKGAAFFTSDAPIFAASVNGTITDTGYSILGSRPTAYNNSTGSTYQVGGYQTQVDYIDVYYDDGNGVQHVKIDHSTSANGNSIIKCAVYMKDGVLKFANKSNSFPSGATKLFITAATSDSATGAIKFRCYKVDGNITIVPHYYENEKTVTFNNIEELGAADTVREYLVDDSTANQYVLMVGNTYSSTTGIALEVTPKTGTTLDYIAVGNGTDSATIAHADLAKTLYLSSSFTFSETAATDDILKYENGKYTVYKVDTNLTVDYVDAYTITLDTGYGTLAATQADTVDTVDGKITEPALQGETVDVSGTIYYLWGWYDGTDALTANLIDFTQPFDSSKTIYALWGITPQKNIVVNNAYGDNATDAITTTNASKFAVFNGATGKARVLKGTEDASLTIHAVHGMVSSITAKIGDGSDITLDSTNLFTAEDKTVYINADGTVAETKEATCAVEITRNISAKTFDVTYYNVNDDVILTLNYAKLNVKFVYGDNDTEYSTSEIDFNTAAEEPNEVSIDGYFFDGWYTDKDYDTTFDFTQSILDDTTVYGKVTVKHTITYVGAYSSSTTPISSQEWESRVGTGLFDANNAVAYTRGDFCNTSGAKTTFNAAAGTVKSITFAFDGKTIKFEGEDVTGKNSTGYYLFKDGTYSAPVGTENKEDILALFVHAKATSDGGTYYDLRYYSIDCDVTVTIEYETVTVVYTDEQNATNVFNIDTKTSGTVADVANCTFTVDPSELKGNNANSIRIAIDPNLSLVKGLKIYETANPDNYEEFTFVGTGASATDAMTSTKFGKISYAYSIASTATDGIIYVRFLNLNKNITITPIYYDIEGSHTATIESSSELNVSNEGVPSGVTLSDDGRTITAEHGTLGKVTTAVADKASSFRWNLGPTGANAYEYSKIEVYDADTEELIATLDTDVKTGNAFVANADATADQTCTLMDTANKVFVKYNKAMNSSAQIRVWALNRNIKIKVYYKDFTNDSADTLGTDGMFPSVSAKVTYKYNVAEKDYATSKFDFVTANTQTTSGSDGTVNTISVSLDSKELSGSNTEKGRTDSNAVISGIIRLTISDAGKYETKKVRIYTTGDNAVSYELTASKTITDTKLGSFQYVKDGANNYIRFNSIFTDKEIFIETEQEKTMQDGPYKVVLEAENDLGVTYDTSNPSSVVTSNDQKTITVNEGQLNSSASGQSVLWTLSSTAGMDFEYSKLEIYELKNDQYELIKTIGENLQSYKEYSTEKDQTVALTMNGLSLRYNKSHYGDAQIRIWNVYRNIKLVVYYKDYTTGEEYVANNDAINVVYDGVVTLSTNGAKVTTETNNSPITMLNGVYKIRFNKFAAQAQGVKYIFTTANEGDRIEYAVVTINGQSYKIGEGLAVYGAVTKNYPGAKITYYRNSDGYAQMRIWNVSDDVDVSLVISSGHKHTITFDAGEGATVKIADIPASATITDDLRTCVVYEGSTYNSTAGKKTSVRYDVTPKVGYELDYIVMSVNGHTYRIDNKELASGKTLSTVVGEGASVRYNTDSNGVAQIRMVHVDADVSVKVYYRTDNHKVIINNRKLSLMRAEGYNSGENTVFTTNYAVGTYIPGSTGARQNGVKYWLKPLNEGQKITGAVLENSYGDYVVMGVGFEEKDYADYKIKGITARYYQAADGKIEIRVWGVTEDATITIFYDDETPVPGLAVSEDIATYDVGEYEEATDNQDIVVDDTPTVPEEKTNTAAIVIGATATVSVAATAIYFFIKKKKIAVTK